MQLTPFKLEQYFAKHEFSTPFMLGSSDAESHSLNELLNMADSEASQLWNNLHLGYTETFGLPLLRQAIANLYQSITASNILVCTGAEEPIYLIFNNLIEPGDHVVLITPCYQSYITLPKALGADVTEVSLDFDKNTWSLHIEKLKNSIKTNTKLIIINFPHNPTSYLPSHDIYQEIIHLARSANAYLLSDEIYQYSEQNNQDRLPAACDCYEKAISISGLSKAFGLAGLRIGWVATHDQFLLNKFSIYKNYLSICNSAPSEILALIAIREKEKIIKRNLNIINTNLALLDQFFSKTRHLFAWSRPTAGNTAFPKLTLPISIEQFAEDLINEQGVLILPGTVYDNTGNHFRIGFARRNMPEALERFNKFITKYL